MTLAELERLIQSKKRINQKQEQEKASFDYILADLIGRSVSRIYNNSNKMPTIAEAYPSLFNSEEVEEKLQAQRDKLTAIRFKQFVNAFNTRFKEANENK